jgi:hypothetical protein
LFDQRVEEIASARLEASLKREQSREFLADILPRQEHKERAIRTGDPEPRLQMWSHWDPLAAVASETLTGMASGSHR